MPAKNLSINLLERDATQNPIWSRLLTWVTTYGRYIMITTELIVLIAFASRFSLDRKLTDLKEDIMQKQEILEVNAPLETEIRTTQQTISKVKALLAEQSKPFTILTSFQALIPPGVYAQTLTVEKTKLTANIAATSLSSFLRFVGNLAATKAFAVELGSISKQKNLIECTVTAVTQESVQTEKK